MRGDKTDTAEHREHVDIAGIDLQGFGEHHNGLVVLSSYGVVDT
jgi:hypothetical protein